LPGVSAEEVVEALKQPTFEEHEIVVAHIWNGMSFRQIAEAFQLSS
jgi:hypothetical protein